MLLHKRMDITNDKDLLLHMINEKSKSESERGELNALINLSINRSNSFKEIKRLSTEKSSYNERKAATDKLSQYASETTVTPESLDQLKHEISEFKSLDNLIKSLNFISATYKPNNPKRIKSLNELHTLLKQSYMNYADGDKPTEEIIKNLKEQATIISTAVESEHEKGILGRFGITKSRLRYPLIQTHLQN